MSQYLRQLKLLGSAASRVLMMFGLAFAAWNGVRFGDVRDEKGGIYIDTGRPVSVSWPCQIRPTGPKGEWVFYIGPEAPQAWRGGDGGSAVYRFYVPEDGDYCVWAYTYWTDACTNAVFARFDGAPKAIIGNDPVYGKWHWVRSWKVPLKKGTHQLELSDHDNNVAVQRLFLARSSELLPSDGERFEDLFYDDLNGCDRGNFASWTIGDGDWRIRDAEVRSIERNNVLVGHSFEHALLLQQPKADWHNYRMNVLVRVLEASDSTSEVGLCVGVKSETEYYQVTWRPQAGHSGQVPMVLEYVNGKSRIRLGECSVAWTNGEWHEVEVRAIVNEIAVVVNGQPVESWHVTEPAVGGIALSLTGNTVASFDNIRVRSVQANASRESTAAVGGETSALRNGL